MYKPNHSAFKDKKRFPLIFPEKGYQNKRKDWEGASVNLIKRANLTLRTYADKKTNLSTIKIRLKKIIYKS